MLSSHDVPIRQAQKFIVVAHVKWNGQSGSSCSYIIMVKCKMMTEMSL